MFVCVPVCSSCLARVYKRKREILMVLKVGTCIEMPYGKRKNTFLLGEVTSTQRSDVKNLVANVSQEV